MPKDSPGRILGLDGLRALAIGAVLVAHVMGTRWMPHPKLLVLVFGHLGVRLFFVISGYLITTLLLRERARTGEISLRGFFVRRAWRIFPAFFAYLAVVGALALLGRDDVSGPELGAAATYTADFQQPHAWWTWHLWSLAVEEQFYLLWPFTLALAGPRRALAFALASLALAPIFRLIGDHVLGEDLDQVAEHAFPFVFDALASGCVLALAWDWLEAWAPYRRVLESRLFWLVPLAAFAMFWVTFERPRIHLLLGLSVANLALTMSVHRVVRSSEDLATRALEVRPLVWVGTLSYSLYLWQQPFFDANVRAWYTTLPLSLGCALLVAAASYYGVERPILRWRARRR